LASENQKLGSTVADEFGARAQFSISTLELNFNDICEGVGVDSKLQELEFCKTDQGLLDRNKRRIDALIKNGRATMREAAYRPVAGTMLSRLYQGKQYHVIAAQDGTYEFDGRPYESLSKIAYEITGTRWSGPLFFGLRARPETKTSPKKRVRA
jgi:hypothetical protein